MEDDRTEAEQTASAMKMVAIVLAYTAACVVIFALYLWQVFK